MLFNSSHDAAVTPFVLQCWLIYCESDRAYVDEFLFSYRSFLSPEQLFDFLVKRYRKQNLIRFLLLHFDTCYYYNKGTTLFQAKRLQPLKSIFIRSTVLSSKAELWTYFVNVSDLSHILRWVRQTKGEWDEDLLPTLIIIIHLPSLGLAAHFYDFEKKRDLLRAVDQFIENVVRPTQTNEKWYSSLKALIYEQVGDNHVHVCRVAWVKVNKTKKETYVVECKCIVI